jgi:hypothetical protein
MWRRRAVVVVGPERPVDSRSPGASGLCPVRVLEAADTIGGGGRSAELTLPGFTHDVCSAVYPFAAACWFFRSLHLEEHGLSSSLLRAWAVSVQPQRPSLLPPRPRIPSRASLVPPINSLSHSSDVSRPRGEGTCLQMNGEEGDNDHAES